MKAQELTLTAVVAEQNVPLYMIFAMTMTELKSGGRVRSILVGMVFVCERRTVVLESVTPAA